VATFAALAPPAVAVVAPFFTPSVNVTKFVDARQRADMFDMVAHLSDVIVQVFAMRGIGSGENGFFILFP
jgi:hypothetical protein